MKAFNESIKSTKNQHIDNNQTPHIESTQSAPINSWQKVDAQKSHNHYIIDANSIIHCKAHNFSHIIMQLSQCNVAHGRYLL